MINQFFVLLKTQRRMHEGPLGCYMDSLAVLLHEQGYTKRVVREKIKMAADLSRWLHRCHLNVSDINRNILIKFLRGRKQTHCAGKSVLNQLLKLLQMNEVIRQK